MVDREKVIKALEKCSFRDCPTCPYYSPNDSRCIRELIYDALTLLKEQEPKTGHWIFYFDDKSVRDGYKCSECGFAQPWYYDYFEYFEFCPHCGAKMID